MRDFPKERNPSELCGDFEARLIAELEASRLTYMFATEQYKRAIFDDLNSNRSKAPVTSITEARNSQRDALEKYRRALEVFNNFLRRGD